MRNSDKYRSFAKTVSFIHCLSVNFCSARPLRCSLQWQLDRASESRITSFLCYSQLQAAAGKLTRKSAKRHLGDDDGLIFQEEIVSGSFLLHVLKNKGYCSINPPLRWCHRKIIPLSSLVFSRTSNDDILAVFSMIYIVNCQWMLPWQSSPYWCAAGSCWDRAGTWSAAVQGTGSFRAAVPLSKLLHHN